MGHTPAPPIFAYLYPVERQGCAGGVPPFVKQSGAPPSPTRARLLPPLGSPSDHPRSTPRVPQVHRRRATAPPVASIDGLLGLIWRKEISAESRELARGALRLIDEFEAQLVGHVEQPEPRKDSEYEGRERDGAGQGEQGSELHSCVIA